MSIRTAYTTAVSFLRDKADPWSKWATVIAVVIGGTWAWWNFHIADSTSSNAEIGVSAEVLDYGKDTRLLVVHLTPKNIGKVPIEVTGDGLSIAVTKLPADAKVGRMEVDKLKPDYTAPHIERKYGGYTLEPGVELDETETFVVPSDAAYLVEGEMDLGDDWTVGKSMVIRVK